MSNSGESNVFLPLLLMLQAAQAPCGPCCPSALIGFCRVGCPPPYPVAISRPGPQVSRLDGPHPKGVAILEIGISDEGRIVSACVLRGLRPDADRAAQDAALRWRFTPKVLNGRPVGVVMTVTVEFPPHPHWAPPRITSRSLLPVARGPIAYVDPGTSCPPSRNGQVRAGPQVDPPLLDYVMPEAPVEVDREGAAIVEVVIGADGRVTGARALRGEWQLTDPIVAAAGRWRFARTCIGGRAVPVIKAVRLRRGR